MATVPSSVFDVRRAIGLSPIERRVLELCEAAAERDQPAPSIEDLTVAIGATGVSTVPGIMKRLEAKGFISRRIYQRGRVVCITATGQSTAEPSNTSPHWRFRIDQPQTPTIQAVREKSKPIAAMIEAEARLTGKPIASFLADLVYIGWHEYQAEKERGE
jgi:DNA-binding MarR family transcriptional regulator